MPLGAAARDVQRERLRALAERWVVAAARAELAQAPDGAEPLPPSEPAQDAPHAIRGWCLQSQSQTHKPRMTAAIRPRPCQSAARTCHGMSGTPIIGRTEQRRTRR